MCMDKKYEVKVTRQAMAQMKEIVHYISAELLAPEAANKLLDKMRDAIAALSFMPKKYALIEEEPWKHEGVRKIIVKNFLIYYWVDIHGCRGTQERADGQERNERPDVQDGG